MVVIAIGLILRQLVAEAAFLLHVHYDPMDANPYKSPLESGPGISIQPLSRAEKIRRLAIGHPAPIAGLLLSARHITAAAGISVAISVLLFIASLTQDAFFIDRADNPRAWSPGFGLLLIGWVTVFDGVPAWLANPALLIAWIGLLAGFRRTALASAALALLFAGSFLLCRQLVTNEAGGHSRVTGYGPGYWLWIGSTAVAFLGGTFNLSKAHR